MGEAATDENWVVRLCLRDNEDKWYFIDRNGNINARLSSAQRYNKEIATQFAESITRAAINYIATPRKLYGDGKLWHRPNEARNIQDGKLKKETTMTKLKFKKLNPEAKLPVYAHAGDSGMDICADKITIVEPHSCKKVSSGVAAIIPEGYELQVRPRSGMSSRGIVAAFGTVDEGYRGEIGVTIYNHTDSQYCVHIGDRIAQLVLAPVFRADIEETDDLGEATERGANGFGSTGR